MNSARSLLHEARDRHEAAPRHAIDSRWLVPSDGYAWSAVLRNMSLLLVLLWAAPRLAAWNNFAPWLLMPLIGLFLYRITVVMHDCVHYSLFSNRRSNTIVGVLLGALSGVDFDSFRRQHWRHHRSYGRTGDPEGFQYLELGRLTRRQRHWHLMRPLLGCNLRNVLAESIAAPRNIARQLRSGQIFITASVQIALLALVTELGQYPWLLLLPFLSGATFGLFYSQLRGIAEHGTIGARDSYQVRSHAPRWLDRIFLYDVNFNYHAEHHAHPYIPSCHLPAFHRAIGATSESVSMFQTVCTVYQGSMAPRV